MSDECAFTRPKLIRDDDGMNRATTKSTHVTIHIIQGRWSNLAVTTPGDGAATIDDANAGAIEDCKSSELLRSEGPSVCGRGGT